MEEQLTCGKGLAAQASLPKKMGALADALAENLELHMEALVLGDQNSREEHRAYQTLAVEFRSVAAQPRMTSDLMEGYFNLPMGNHDASKISDPKIVEAFEKFLNTEKELFRLLQVRLSQDENMLANMHSVSR